MQRNLSGSPGFRRSFFPPPGTEPPVAPARPAGPGADPYGWMRDHGDPALLDYLAAERAYYDRQTARAAPVRRALLEGMAARTTPSGESVSWRQGAYRYFTRDLPGREYQQFCRSELLGSPAQTLLDGNLLLDEAGRAGAYVGIGVLEVSPDGRLLAYSVDFDGDGVYQLRIRELASGEDLTTDRGTPERIGRTSCGLAWSAGSRSVFYTVTDAAHRPCQVWCHDIGTAPRRDVLVFTEDDERFEVTVRATRSGAFILIEAASRDTTETLVMRSDEPGCGPAVLKKRVTGVSYRADHADGAGGGEFYLVTNENAAEFALVRGPASGRGPWTEVIGAAPGTRLVSCEVFARHVVVTQRHGFATQLRVLDRGTGEQRLIEAPGPEVSLSLAHNPEYAVGTVTVRTSSLIDPPSWHGVDLVTGRWRLLKRQDVPAYDPSAYRTERIFAPAPDGTPVPVTIAYRDGYTRDGSAPCLLYGYGAHESCEWPEFSLEVASLLDHGFLYAIAHVRGGGEGGRRWWLAGRLERKRTTFTDYIAVADALAAGGWADPERIVSRGLSAGGLLQGAVFSMAPQRWRAVIAEVPFTDVVATMLDATIPLTVTEWDEWGDPRDPAVRAYLESYSPCDNIPAGPWPDLLVTGVLHDPRVGVHEPAKWVARLRAAGGGRVLLRAELGAGAHTGPAGRYGRLAYEAEILAFILEVTGA